MTLLEPSHLLIIHESYPAHLLTQYFDYAISNLNLKWTKIHTLFGSFTILRNKIFLFLSLLTMDMQEQEEDSSNFYSMKVTIESKLYVIRSNAWQQIYSYKIPVSSNIAWRNKIKRHKVTYKLQPAVVLLSKR